MALVKQPKTAGFRPKSRYDVLVACKRRSSVNSRAWLWRFDDVTGVVKTEYFALSNEN